MSAIQHRLMRWVPMDLRAAIERSRWASTAARGLPRIALVKQDCNEDLYCCPSGVDALATVQSTLLRSGPAALLTRFDTTFILVETEPDEECAIWREKSDVLGWCPASWFEAFRDRVPGRDFGQSRYARNVAQIDWSVFDIVVSVDVSVPSRITRQFPNVVWAYYVRELKAPSWHASLSRPVNGQDIYLTQLFPPNPPRSAEHAVHFPYHFQYVGLFHDLVGKTFDSPVKRRGVFVEYHTAREATDGQLKVLERFGPVYAKRVADDVRDLVSGERVPARSMDPDALRAMMSSKYHVKWAGRGVFGTAKVEAIAAGCLALYDRSLDGTGFLQTAATSPLGFDALVDSLERFELEDARYRSEVARQRRLVDYLCFHRPALDLLRAASAVRRTKRSLTTGSVAWA